LERISQARAEMIARSHACEQCGEYSYKKLTVKAATPDQERSLSEAWHATLTCGVCGLVAEMGIDAEGDIVYVG
jgi:transcription elongation factor Elf1